MMEEGDMERACGGSFTRPDERPVEDQFLTPTVAEAIPSNSSKVCGDSVN